ncbi:MAG: thrombospondin type 3 repeat-containing protein, partial [Candidatus Aenigmarchaeota archaeon]|nr:thrombospondin type 3 repeat-containing protein [Candidatus Aenigmarchaeota archaeon]
TDGDSFGNACDSCPYDANNDVDGDGVCGDVDNCPNKNNPGQQDCDGDSIGDACDTSSPCSSDTDGDGVMDIDDNCPNTYNPGQQDGDSDGIGDACDACPNDAQNDVDTDGVCGDVDNCPTISNPNQADLDSDGSGDVCDNDIDGDGTNNSKDCQMFDPKIHPNAAELCDGVDQDCDNVHDEDFDNDNDKYTTCYTYTLDGHTTTYNDCNDEDPSINPSATEVCCEPDMNCDGLRDWPLICPQCAVEVTTNYFDGRTTDFSAITDFANVQLLILEKRAYGIIRFTENVNFSYAVALDPPSANISRNFARINTTMLRMLDRAADITFFDLSINGPLVLRNGALCPSSICSGVTVNGNNYSFSVESFSDYKIEGSCSDGTLYGHCSSDKPKYCTSAGALADDCGRCGCPSGKSCSDGQCVSQSDGSPGDGGTHGGPICTEGAKTPCGKSTGICEPGFQECINGAWGECLGGQFPKSEECNDLDDDCNGLIDDGISCECAVGATKQCGLNTGVCVPGHRICVSGKWSDECISGIAPTNEICDNGLDDDCDGDTDEQDCMLLTNTSCADGPISESCICGGKLYNSGFCRNDIYFKEDPLPAFPYEVLSYVGAMIISLLLAFMVYRQVVKYRDIQKRIGPGEHEKAKKSVPMRRHVHWVSDITSDPRSYLDTKVTIGGYLRMSRKVSKKEYWYSFYDQISTIALKSDKKLKEGYSEVTAVVKTTPLGYVYVEPE